MTNSIKDKKHKEITQSLSDHILTEEKLSVLTKGLSFLPTPTKIFKHDANRSWKKFKTRLLTQYIFRNNIQDKISPFKKKSSWTHPPCDNPTWTNIFTRTEYSLISVTTPGGKTYNNLTLKEKSALSYLKKNKSFGIKTCDKGGGICIMNTKDYLTKIHTYLQDRTTYKPLTYNPTSAIVNDTCTLIEYIHSQHIIDKATKEFLLPPKKYPHPSLLWATQNSQARLHSPPYCYWVWWSNWPSLCLRYPFHPAPS